MKKKNILNKEEFGPSDYEHQLEHHFPVPDYPNLEEYLRKRYERPARAVIRSADSGYYGSSTCSAFGSARSSPVHHAMTATTHSPDRDHSQQGVVQDVATLASTGTLAAFGLLDLLVSLESQSSSLPLIAEHSPRTSLDMSATGELSRKYPESKDLYPGDIFELPVTPAPPPERDGPRLLRRKQGIRSSMNIRGTQPLALLTLARPLDIPTVSILDDLARAYAIADAEPSTALNVDAISREIGVLINQGSETDRIDENHTFREMDTVMEEDLNVAQSSEEGGSGSDFEDSSETSLMPSEHTFSFSSISSDASMVGTALTVYQREVVESLMREFGTFFCQELGHSSGRVKVGGSARSDQSQGSGQSSPTRPNSNEKSSENRDLSNFPGPGGDNEGPASLNDDPPPVRKLACPYYKREPWKHTKHRSCAGPGWLAIHRVK